MKDFFEKNKGLLGVVALIVAVVLLSVLYSRLSEKPGDGKKTSPTPTVTTAATPTEAQTNPTDAVGTPTDAVTPTPTETPAKSKNITVKVVNDKGEETVYSLSTDQEFLRGAVGEIPELTIEGTESEYGLMIDTINGLRADYTLDGAYWSIYVNGDYGMHGLDTQPVADGDVYSFEYTKA